MHREFTNKYVCFVFSFSFQISHWKNNKKYCSSFKITDQHSKDFSPVLTVIFTVIEGKLLTVNTVGLSGSKVQQMPNARGKKKD